MHPRVVLNIPSALSTLGTNFYQTNFSGFWYMVASLNKLAKTVVR